MGKNDTKHKITIIGYKGFIGQRIKNISNRFDLDLLSKNDFNAPDKKDMIVDIIKKSELVVLLSFINSNSLFNEMHRNVSFCKKLFKYVDRYDKKLLFISSDSADHASTPYGQSKIECESLFNDLKNFWYIRPGPVYLRKKLEFKGILGKILFYKFKLLPLPFSGNFKIKLFSIEELTDLMMSILNNSVKRGEVEIKKIIFREFLRNNFSKIYILNIPNFVLNLILAMPNKIKYKIPIDIIFTSKINNVINE